MKPRALCIHGHFYQPPRENPFTGCVSREPQAAPYHDFNQKIDHECYRPNAQLGNYERISFNFGPTLLSWLESNDSETYQAILAADGKNKKAHGIGNSIAQSYYHIIFPLASRLGKRTQVTWGILDFVRRYGRQPIGLWLPETAVDMETLEILAEAGLLFTILDRPQVEGEIEEAGPYRVDLGSRRSIAVFVRNKLLSNKICFPKGKLESADLWSRHNLQSHCKTASPLTLIALDGEYFGHHHEGGERFLRELLVSEVGKIGYAITYLSKYLEERPPERSISVVENTAWSCGHGVDRWARGCSCTRGNSTWKKALRDALNHLAGELDGIYVRESQTLELDPWSLRNDYIRVMLKEWSFTNLLSVHGASGFRSAVDRRMELLLESQRYRQAMFTSCAFFFEKLDRLEPRYGIANATKAIYLVREATGIDLLPGFRRHLQAVTSDSMTGAQILDLVLTNVERTFL